MKAEAEAENGLFSMVIFLHAPFFPPKIHRTSHKIPMTVHHNHGNAAALVNQIFS